MVLLKKTARNAVCWLLANVLILLGYARKARLKSFQDGVITSICFHNPSKKSFRSIIIWLKKNGYTFISCEQLIDNLNKKAACPRGAAWISLDDGWKDNINNVIPTAIEFDIPVTLFICTDSVESGAFWWREVRQYARYIPAKFRNPAKLRQMPDEGRKQILKLMRQMTAHLPSKREAITIEDIRNISALSQVTIGSHTASHPVLPNCTDQDIDYELGESKRKLEEWTGKPARALAYPSGAFDDRTKQWLQKHGYELAATMEGKFARSDNDCYLVPRTDAMDDGSFAENLCHALGIWGPMMKKVKGIFKHKSKKIMYSYSYTGLY